MPNKGHDIRITDTVYVGMHSGRRRYRVICIECGTIIHPATTGPGERVRQHLDSSSNDDEEPLPEGEPA
jgi:hypothetical protein